MGSAPHSPARQQTASHQPAARKESLSCRPNHHNTRMAHPTRKITVAPDRLEAVADDVVLATELRAIIAFHLYAC